MNRLIQTTLLFTLVLLTNKTHGEISHNLSSFLPEDFLNILNNPKDFKNEADLIKKDREFFIRDGHKFALEIKRKDNSINYIHYTCTKSSNCPPIDIFKKSNPKSSFYLSQNQKSKYNGRYIILDDKKNGLQYYFKNDSKKLLKYIIYNKETKEN